MRRPHLRILKSDLHSAATHCLKGVLEGGSQHSPLGLWEACDAVGNDVLASSPKLPRHHKESQRGQPGRCSASWRGLNREDKLPCTAGCLLAVAYCITSKGSSRHEHEAAGSTGQLAAGSQQGPVRLGNPAAGWAAAPSGAHNKHTLWCTRQLEGQLFGLVHATGHTVAHQAVSGRRSWSGAPPHCPDCWCRGRSPGTPGPG